MDHSFYSALSFALSPLTVELIMVFLLSLYSPFGIGSLNVTTSIIIGLVFLFILPVVILYRYSKGDIEMSKREDRNTAYPLVILSFAASTLIFWTLGSQVMFLISLAYLTVTSACYVVNMFWKISVHSAGMAGPITALVFIFGINMTPLFALLIPVFLVRLKLKAHNVYQLTAGVLVSISITSLVYLL
jgi:hypothetical protein